MDDKDRAAIAQMNADMANSAAELRKGMAAAAEGMRAASRELSTAFQEAGSKMVTLNSAAVTLPPDPEEKAATERRVLGKQRMGTYTRPKARTANRKAQEAARRRNRK